MSEILLPPRPSMVAVQGEAYDTSDFFNFHIRTRVDRGWSFNWGDPELWRFKDQLFDPSGRVLDVGIHDARLSMMFALSGMSVDGIDRDEDFVGVVNAVGHDYAIPLQASYGDINCIDLPRDTYSLALLGHTFIHYPSKADAYETLDKVFDALSPGGHLWIRAAGKEDDTFANLKQRGTLLDDDVIEYPCNCSGELVMDEKHLFFDQTELLRWAHLRGMRIVHSQVVPRRHTANIMYGEDDPHNGWDIPTRGFITVLSQKRK